MSQEQRIMNDTDDVSETESPRYLTALSTSEKKKKKIKIIIVITIMIINYPSYSSVHRSHIKLIMMNNYLSYFSVIDSPQYYPS